MKKVYKIIFILIIFLIILAQVTKVSAITVKNPWDLAKDFLKVGADHTGMTDESIKIQEALGVNTVKDFERLIDFLWGLGLMAIFVTTVILGIRYMLVPPGEKSRIKEATTPYVIGVIIIFGALTIWKLVIVLLEGSI